ncbi:hypothetical protein AB0M86_45490 [Streptomyces sp. NPDC051639]|uniref:hypothetical protein n=1 Tax=unclassified Streptomyces TaxID=2593676 RepID=UPI002E34FE1E|nr:MULTISPECIES: hypothetical protein [unclassified Streptomyces]
MEKSEKSRASLASWRNGRVVLLFLVVLGLFCGAGWTFLNKGLYLLPGKMCEGTLERDMVKSVLPSARSADSGSDSQGAGDGLAFWCHVTTSDDSSLSGEARVQPTSREKWLAYYRGSGGKNRIIRVSVGGIEALAQVDSGADTSSVYVPCAPPSVPSYNASQPYAVVGEARIHGTARATGVPLRQTLTDFAYQLAQHAYKLAECKDPRAFPEELPRYPG